MELYIIRHAQSSNNVLTDSSRRVTDPPLTTIGEQQAQLVAQHLTAVPEASAHLHPVAAHHNRAGFALTRLFTSPMRRALQTARPIGAALGRQPEVWVDIHETGGMFLDHHDGRGPVGTPGLTRVEIAAPAQSVGSGWLPWSRPRSPIGRHRASA
ncbi:MAG: hypothetical protein CL878_01430, partial [Dehalococcoidia bacterium]|nr:hypothetical protein [Dehalococcoidia bacterium]